MVVQGSLSTSVPAESNSMRCPDETEVRQVLRVRDAPKSSDCLIGPRDFVVPPGTRPLRWRQRQDLMVLIILARPPRSRGPTHRQDFGVLRRLRLLRVLSWLTFYLPLGTPTRLICRVSIPTQLARLLLVLPMLNVATVRSVDHGTPCYPRVRRLSTTPKYCRFIRIFGILDIRD